MIGTTGKDHTRRAHKSESMVGQCRGSEAMGGQCRSTKTRMDELAPKKIRLLSFTVALVYTREGIRRHLTCPLHPRHCNLLAATDHTTVLFKGSTVAMGDGERRNASQEKVEERDG